MRNHFSLLTQWFDKRDVAGSSLELRYELLKQICGCYNLVVVDIHNTLTTSVSNICKYITTIEDVFDADSALQHIMTTIETALVEQSTADSTNHGTTVATKATQVTNSLVAFIEHGKGLLKAERALRGEIEAESYHKLSIEKDKLSKSMDALQLEQVKHNEELTQLRTATTQLEQYVKNLTAKNSELTDALVNSEEQTNTLQTKLASVEQTTANYYAISQENESLRTEIENVKIKLTNLRAEQTNNYHITSQENESLRTDIETLEIKLTNLLKKNKDLESVNKKLLSYSDTALREQKTLELELENIQKKNNDLNNNIQHARITISRLEEEKTELEKAKRDLYEKDELNQRLDTTLQSYRETFKSIHTTDNNEKNMKTILYNAMNSSLRVVENMLNQHCVKSAKSECQHNDSRQTSELFYDYEHAIHTFITEKLDPEQQPMEDVVLAREEHIKLLQKKLASSQLIRNELETKLKDLMREVEKTEPMDVEEINVKQDDSASKREKTDHIPKGKTDLQEGKGESYDHRDADANPNMRQTETGQCSDINCQTYTMELTMIQSGFYQLVALILGPKYKVAITSGLGIEKVKDDIKARFTHLTNKINTLISDPRSAIKPDAQSTDNANCIDNCEKEIIDHILSKLSKKRKLNSADATDKRSKTLMDNTPQIKPNAIAATQTAVRGDAGAIKIKTEHDSTMSCSCTHETVPFTETAAAIIQDPTTAHELKSETLCANFPCNY